MSEGRAHDGDVIVCGWCSLPLRRNARAVLNRVRYHQGTCAASSRAITWPEERLEAHMQKMRDAAARTRAAALVKRLRRAAPGVPEAVARALYMRGYKAGFTAVQRKRGSKP